MSVKAVASVAVCSLSNRLSVLVGLVLLTGLTGGVELFDFIIKSGLEVDTLDSDASVNSVDLDAVVDGDFFAVMIYQFLRVCE